MAGREREKSGAGTIKPRAGAGKPPKPLPRPSPSPLPSGGGGGGGGGGTDESDPPIIVQGGSVTIISKVFLHARFDERTLRYIYETDKIKIKKIKTKGTTDQEDDSNNGVFRIDLFD